MFSHVFAKRSFASVEILEEARNIIILKEYENLIVFELRADERNKDFYISRDQGRIQEGASAFSPNKGFPFGIILWHPF